MPQSIILQPQEPELTFCVDDLPVLTALITLPRRENPRCARFNRYYRAYAETFKRSCQHELFPRAESAYYQAREHSLAIPQWQAQLRSTVTLQREHLISLRTDTALTGAPQPYCARRGDTWDLRHGFLLSLADCFPPHTPWRKQLLAFSFHQICDWEAQGIARYHDDWQRQIHRAFHPHNFYLTEEGLCFFFPFASIAPPIEGIPTFCIPYNDQSGPFIPSV